MTSKPSTYTLRLDIEQFAFDKTQEEFESTLNLELAIIHKEMREKIMEDYVAKNNPDKLEP